MVKVWFPSMFMRLISGISLFIFNGICAYVFAFLVNVKRKPSEAVFHVAPKMTKTEVKEYLTKIYNLDVFNVTTANYAGDTVLWTFHLLFYNDRHTSY